MRAMVSRLEVSDRTTDSRSRTSFNAEALLDAPAASSVAAEARAVEVDGFTGDLTGVFVKKEEIFPCAGFSPLFS